MTSPFESLCGPGKPLKAEPPDQREFDGLVRSGLARLNDATLSSLSVDSRFDLVYNAAHALSLAALRWHGYRSTNRYIVFQLLPNTLGLGPQVWRVLSKSHEFRNLSEYEGDMGIDEQLVSDLFVACKAVAEKVQALGRLVL